MILAIILSVLVVFAENAAENRAEHAENRADDGENVADFCENAQHVRRFLYAL